MRDEAKPTHVDHSRSILLLVIAYLGFISLGLPDPVAGVAWPFVRDTFKLPQSRFGLVFLGLGCGYCASGFFGGKLTHLLGLGNLLWISSGLVAAAMLGSCFTPAWPLFVACAVVWGLGSGGIDAGLNSYVAVHFSARHMNWLHACYSLGATLGPLVMTAMLLRSGSWRLGYGVVGAILLAMTAVFLVTKARWDSPPKLAVAASEPTIDVGVRAALRNTLVQLQITAFFLYVGLEFTVGQWCFTLLTESRGVGADVAGILAGCYYGSIGVGRILAGVIAPRVGLDRIIRIALLLVLAGAVVFAVSATATGSCFGLLAIGLGLAPFFPCMMARTPQRLGAEYSAHAVGFQVSAGMLGAATVPGIAGLLAERFGLEVIAQFAIALSLLLMATHELLLYIADKARRISK